MATETLTPAQLAGDEDVRENILRRLFRPWLRDRDDRFFWESGQWVLGEYIKRLEAADADGNKKLIRRLKILDRTGAGGVFLGVVIRIAGFTLPSDPNDWLEFLKGIVEWLMSEEGQAFIQMIIDLVMLFIGLTTVFVWPRLLHQQL